MNFSITDIQAAKERISPHIVKTPLLRLSSLDEVLGCQVYAKLESMQVTGAFKFRGAMNKFLTLTEEERARGIVAVSSGNHGKGVAYISRQFGAKATVVMPNGAPPAKLAAIRELGADVVLCDAAQRHTVAHELCEKTGATMVPPFDDPAIMAGQGTIGLEIMEQCPEINTVIIPTSGGGLLGGVATAVKTLSPAVKVYGAEPAATPRFSESLKAGERVTVPAQPSLADALLALIPGKTTFPVVQKMVDGVATVTDEMMLKGMKLMLMKGKVLAEASSCIGVGALLQGTLKVEKDEKVCFLLSGGNVGYDQLKLLDGIEI